MANKKNEKKVLSFNQPAEFYIRKAEKHIDAGNLLQALQLYRKVLGMEPGNTDYLLSIAQVYSEMGLYAESNDVLLKIAKYGNPPTECLFALGCNYMGMGNYEMADEAFEQYLALDPEGEYADDIDELFEIIEEEEYENDFGLHDISRQIIYEKALEGKNCLDKGDFQTAITLLEEVVEKDPTIFSAMNNLALAYFFDGRKEQAIEVSKRVLAAQPLNLHAICNLALFYSDLNDHESASVYLEKIDGIKDIKPEDMHKIALTYCELELHEKAYRWFLKLLSFQPYDIRILHFCGLAAYNCGLYAEALGFFVKILKIDPKNSLALYYSALAQDAKKNGAAKKLEYVYQVQFDEIKRRISYLNECLKQKDGSLEYKWKHDKYFRSIIYWGLHYGDEYIKKIVLEIMSMFSDAEVEEEFRDFLLKSSEKDEIKNDIFMYLKRMGAREPYVAYIRGAIAEVRVGMVSEDIKNLPAPFAEALNTFIKRARTRYDNDFITAGVELLISVVAERKDSGAWVKRPNALAAALELFVSELMDYKRPPLKKDLVKIYGISLRTLNKYYKIMFEDPGAGDHDAD